MGYTPERRERCVRIKPLRTSNPLTCSNVRFLREPPIDRFQRQVLVDLQALLALVALNQLNFHVSETPYSQGSGVSVD
jgi:hypothetical protein